MVELALLLPAALLLTFGSIQFMLYLSCYVGATYGSRAAVRYAIVHGAGSVSPCTATTLANYVQPYLVGVPASATTVTVTWTPDHNAGSTVVINVAFSVPMAVAFDVPRTLVSVTKASGVVLQ